MTAPLETTSNFSNYQRAYRSKDKGFFNCLTEIVKLMCNI